MQKASGAIIRHRKLIIGIYVVLTLLFGVIMNFVPVNYNVMDYLPDDAASTRAIDVMQEEYAAGIPNARAMVEDISIPEALAMKAEIEAIEGVDDVMWLDDVVDVKIPLENQDQNVVEQYYKDGCALFTLTVDDELAKTAMPAIREVVGEDSPMSGLRVNTTFASDTINADIQKIMMIAVPIILVILLLTTNSWFEPVLFLVTIGVAIVLNMGTNIFFGEISFITKGVASILQLAVSMDYAIFILHRFAECRGEGLNIEAAMIKALQKSFTSVSASGVTTIVGFAALILLRIKIGPDVGWVMTKAIIISLICVFTFLPSLTVLCCKLVDKTHHRSLMPDFRKFGRVISRVCIPVMFIFAICVVPSYRAINHNSFVYFDIFTDEKTELGRQANAINEVFGETTTLVLMVEKGDFATEREVSEQIQALPNVVSVTSYVDTVGQEIPTGFVPRDAREQLLSPNYSRMAITLDTYMESEETFAAVETIRSLGEEYYPGGWYLAGESTNTYDMKIIVEEDNQKVNAIAVAAVFVILLLTFRSLSIPFILILVIEGAIWINCGLPYFTGDPLFYIGYLVISSLQLGATVDYAILFTNRYLENRQKLYKRDALIETISNTTVSIFTSGGILFAAGFILSRISSNGLLSQLGLLVGRGALLSLVSVLFVLPALLLLLDRVIQKTSIGLHFLNPAKGEKENGAAQPNEPKRGRLRPARKHEH